jgi:intraflagellar transport protein 122
VKRARELMAMARVAHAEWLAAEDRLEEAQSQYEAAGRPDLSARILYQLAVSAVEERRYADGGSFFLRLAADCAQASRIAAEAGNEGPAAAARLQHAAFTRLGQIYAAYDVVHGFVRQPFTLALPEVVYHAARFLLNAVYGVQTATAKPKPVPHVSVSVALYALARQAMSLECYKTARFALDRLQVLLVPAKWRDVLDLASMHVAVKPYTDREDLMAVCYRCGGSNANLTSSAVSLLTPPISLPTLASAGTPAAAVANGDVCTHCGHAFVRSYTTFEVLPLVEFSPADATPEQALDALLRGEGRAAAPPPSAGAPTGSVMTFGGDQQVMSFGGGGAGGGGGGSDSKSGDALFNDLLNEAVTAAGPTVKVPLSIIRKFKPGDVFVVRPSAPRVKGAAGGGAGAGAGSDVSRGVEEEAAVGAAEVAAVAPRFYKNVMPDVQVCQCGGCCHFFTLEDLEFEVLKRGHCPLCHSPAAVVWG